MESCLRPGMTQFRGWLASEKLGRSFLFLKRRLFPQPAACQGHCLPFPALTAANEGHPDGRRHVISVCYQRRISFLANENRGRDAETASEGGLSPAHQELNATRTLETDSAASYW
jgi:hypothetical protein